MDILAADVGATYTRVAVFSKSGKAKLYHRYENAHFPSITALLHEFRSKHKGGFSKAAIAVAGPVHDGEARMPNLHWHVSEHLVKHSLLCKNVILVNDAYAAAVAIGKVPILKVKEGRPDGVVRALIGPGTGLGVSLVAGKTIAATEAGHSDFAPSSQELHEFWGFLSERYGHVSAERALSGHGLVDLYLFLRERKAAFESKEQREVIDDAYDTGVAIVNAALGGADGVAERAVKLYVGMLAAFAGSYALSTGATGGVYLFGSLANHLRPFLATEEFARAFANKGRLRRWCDKVPVFLVKDTDVVLRGVWMLANAS